MHFARNDKGAPQLSRRRKCPLLDVPDLAGRFVGSISNVAIFPAYMAGINVDEFTQGLENGYNTYMNFKVNEASKMAIYL